MAIQPAQPVQLPQDPYAVSRTGFSEVLGYFKEQRALRQAAKQEAKRFEMQKEATQFEYDLRLRNEMAVQGIREQGNIATEQVRQQTEWLKQMRAAEKEARDYAKEWRSRFSEVSKVQKYSLMPNVVIDGMFDPESLSVGVAAYSTLQGLDESGTPVMRTVEYDEADLEEVLGRARTLLPVADLVESYFDPAVPKPQQTVEHGSYIVLGADERGREIINFLTSQDPTKFDDPEFQRMAAMVAGGHVSFGQRDLTVEKRQEDRTKDLVDVTRNLTTAISNLSSDKFGQVVFKNFVGNWLGGAGKSIDFNTQPVQDILDILRTTQNTMRWDGLSNAQIEQMRGIGDYLAQALDVFRMRENPQDPQSVDVSTVYFNPTKGQFERRFGAQAPTATPSPESRLNQILLNTD